MHRHFACLFSAALFSVGLLVADEPSKPKDREFTAEEKELLAVCEEWSNTISQQYQEAEKINDPEQQQLFLREVKETGTFEERMIAFEKAHRGEPVGLLALRFLILAGNNTDRPIGPYYRIATHAFEVLPQYGEHAALTELLRYLEFCELPETEDVFRTFIALEKGISENNRDYAKLIFASWIIRRRDNREFWRQTLRDVDSGNIEAAKWERDVIVDELGRSLPEDKVSALLPEATDILETLVASDSSSRRVDFKPVNGSHYIFQTKAGLDDPTMPRVKDLAAGLLFRENHLQDGRPAPDLNVKLVSGADFSFEKQRGKVLVVQFSFTGCGPCEATYPTLTELAGKHADRLSVITFMRDPTPDDAQEAVRSGKMTWNVTWDGYTGVNAAWGVVGFPTIYIFGSDGRLVHRQLRRDKLREKVEELLK